VVAEIKGAVIFTSPDGTPVPVQRGTILTADSKIETVKGSVLLQLQDGSQALIKGHSNVVLRAPNQGKGFSLELFLGQILMKVQKRTGEAPSFRMGTPSAVITVRGTRFQVEVNKKHKTYVDVFEGLVEVEGLVPGSPHILLRPGFYSGVDPDRAPSEPRESTPNDGNGREGEREGQNPGTQRNSGEQERPQPKPGGSEGKPD
jgi:ferric-dicitrate binding protein FerR (iron transport regulator)